MSGRAGSDIVLCLPHMGDGGTQRVVSILANAWSHRGLRVTILTIDPRPSTYPLDPAIRCLSTERILERVGRWLTRLRPTATSELRLPMRDERFARARALAFLADRVWQIRRILQRERAPVVVAFLTHANILAALASRGQPWRLVISERVRPDQEELPFPWPALRRRVYGWADLVTANSQHALELLRTHVDPAKLELLPNPVLSPDPAAVLPADQREHAFLAVGRLSHQKGFDVLLRAFARLPEALHGWRLRILGRGPLGDSLAALAQSLGLGDRVQWCGHVADPGPYYAAASVFVQSSRTEGMSNALLEAMSFGLAPIVSDASVGGVEILSHGESALIVPAGDAAALTDALVALARDEALRARIGAAARKRLAGFELSRAMAAWDDALGIAVGGSPRPQ